MEKAVGASRVNLSRLQVPPHTEQMELRSLGPYLDVIWTGFGVKGDGWSSNSHFRRRDYASVEKVVATHVQ